MNAVRVETTVQADGELHLTNWPRRRGLEQLLVTRHGGKAPGLFQLFLNAGKGDGKYGFRIQIFDALRYAGRFDCVVEDSEYAIPLIPQVLAKIAVRSI